MDLFAEIKTEPIAVLDTDGEVWYHGRVVAYEESETFLFNLLSKICWKNDEVNIFGRHIVTKRKVAWYGEKPFEYTYSNATKKALPWTKELLLLKSVVENETGDLFNACLLNLYHDGSEGMAWHSDAELDLKRNGAIASLSFGAERKFCFKHKKSKETVSLMLENGSLLVMKGETQTHWLHRLPPTKKVDQPRVNLTFRTIDSKLA